MCRLFGLTAGSNRINASFWILKARHSLLDQSYGQPDGAGLGTFNAEDRALMEKAPIAAHDNPEFLQEIKERKSTTFVCHIRFASVGKKILENTHPFREENRLFAHNGTIGNLGKLEKEIGDKFMPLVKGETDSERFFALITRHIHQKNGDIVAGITSAAQLVVDMNEENKPENFSINFILTTPTELFALRYPDQNTLFLLRRSAGGQHGDRHLDQSSAASLLHVRSAKLATIPSVVVASERLDEAPEWEELKSGQLLHVNRDLDVHITEVIKPPAAPARTVDKSDSRPVSQSPG